MQLFRSTFGGLILVLLIMAAILFAKMPQLATSPNSWLIGDTYDGFRSYAAMVYHVRHDSTYQHFEGMHYPYGDYNAFTDNLPLVTNALKAWSNNFGDVSAYCGGTLNLFLLGAIILCAVFLFLSFKKLDLPTWYAVPAAIGITLLSPQWYRIEAHYGLAAPFVLPMVFWLSLIFHHKKRFSTSLLIGFVLFLVAQIHFYLFAISAAFILGLFFFKSLFAAQRKAWIINALHALVQIVLPLLILQWLLYDNLTDRPTRPYGFFAYKATWQSVFLPVKFQLGRWINEYLYRIPSFSMEGIAYIGIVPLLFLIKEFFQKTLNRIFGNTYFSIQEEKNRFFLKAVFWAASLLLLFSFAFPFTLPGLEKIPEKLGLLAQFRSLGRFAWCFFYVFNIIVFYALFFQIKKVKNLAWQRFFFALVLGACLLEGGIFVKDKVKLRLYPTPDQRADFRLEDNQWIKTINLDNYQAIVNVPYFHIGSENIWVSPRNKEVHRSMWLAAQTGLPIHSSFMGRTSVGQVLDQLQLIGEPYRDPVILDHYKNKKDLLVFVHLPAYKNVSARYRHFLKDLKLLYENQQIRVYHLPLDLFAQRINANQNGLKKEIRQLSDSLLYQHQGFQTTDSLARVVYQSFDQFPSEKVYRGNGAIQSSGSPVREIYDGHLPFQQSRTWYDLSLWVYMQGDLHPKTRLFIEEYQPGTPFIIDTQEIELNKHFRAIEDGWMLCEFAFRLWQPDSRFRIKIFNPDRGSQPIFVDELLIRPQKTIFYKKEATEFMYNNRWWEE